MTKYDPFIQLPHAQVTRAWVPDECTCGVLNICYVVLGGVGISFKRSQGAATPEIPAMTLGM